MAERATDRNQTQEAGTGSVLDRRVGPLTVEHLFYLVLFGIAVFTCLYQAGVRPQHHDESIHAFYSWKIVTDGVGHYKYDPVYHGPVLYYWTALIFWVFGDSDFTARLSPVLFGLGLFAFAWPLRRYLGRWGAISYLALVTLSPSFTYFARFLRHDIYVAFCNVAAVYFAFRYGETRQARQLYLAVAALALAFCTKEDMYALAPVFVVSLVFTMVWEVTYASDWRTALREATAESVALLRRSLLPLFTGGVIFALIWALFYTSLGSHPENWNGVTRALSYWWGQHEIQRIGGPWWYYFPHLFAYEGLIFFPAFLLLVNPLLTPRAGEGKATLALAYMTWTGFTAFAISLLAAPLWAPHVLLAALTLAGLTLMRRWLPDRFTRFVVIWTVGSFVFYAWAQEKVPWLLIPILTPMVLLTAIWFREAIDSGRIRRLGTAVALSLLTALTVWTLIASNYLYDAPRPDEAPGPRHAELLAYVQSTYDIHKVMDRIEEVGEILDTGPKTRLAVSGNSTWPMSWYLRHYPVNWAGDVRRVDTPVVIVDKESTRAIDAAVLDRYEKVPFQIRGWWEPNWRQMDLAKVVHFLLTREAFSGVGSSDAVMYVLKDLQPGAQIAAVEVNPPPAARSYPREATAIEPQAVWGHQGADPGEFNEPRGLAVDAQGRIYVVDSKNHRVQTLAPDGRVLATWGGPGDAPGRFKDPGGIAINAAGLVYVADTWNHRVQKFDANGTFISEMRPESGFWGPRGVAVAGDGSVYVTDTGNKRIVVFDAADTEVKNWGREGSEDGLFIEPVGIAVDAQGQVLVADTGNRRVQVFDADGTYRSKLKVYGWEEFYTEPHLTLLGGDLLVTDSHNHRFARYTREGKLVDSWGKSGAGPGAFNRPIGIAATATGTVYVADTLNHRIQSFSLAAPGS